MFAVAASTHWKSILIIVLSMLSLPFHLQNHALSCVVTVTYYSLYKFYIIIFVKSTFHHLGGSENRATPSPELYVRWGSARLPSRNPSRPVRQPWVTTRAPPGVEQISSTYKHVLHKPWYTVESDGFGTTVAHSYRHFSYHQPLFFVFTDVTASHFGLSVWLRKSDMTVTDLQMSDYTNV